MARKPREAYRNHIHTPKIKKTIYTLINTTSENQHADVPQILVKADLMEPALIKPQCNINEASKTEMLASINCQDSEETLNVNYKFEITMNSIKEKNALNENIITDDINYYSKTEERKTINSMCDGKGKSYLVTKKSRHISEINEGDELIIAGDGKKVCASSNSSEIEEGQIVNTFDRNKNKNLPGCLNVNDDINRYYPIKDVNLQAKYTNQKKEHKYDYIGKQNMSFSKNNPFISPGNTSRKSSSCNNYWLSMKNEYNDQFEQGIGSYIKPRSRGFNKNRFLNDKSYNVKGLSTYQSMNETGGIKSTQSIFKARHTFCNDPSYEGNNNLSFKKKQSSTNVYTQENYLNEISSSHIDDCKLVDMIKLHPDSFNNEIICETMMLETIPNNTNKNENILESMEKDLEIIKGESENVIMKEDKINININTDGEQNSNQHNDSLIQDQMFEPTQSWNSKTRTIDNKHSNSHLNYIIESQEHIKRIGHQSVDSSPINLTKKSDEYKTMLKTNLNYNDQDGSGDIINEVTIANDKHNKNQTILVNTIDNILVNKNQEIKIENLEKLIESRKIKRCKLSSSSINKMPGEASPKETKDRTPEKQNFCEISNAESNEEARNHILDCGFTSDQDTIPMNIRRDEDLIYYDSHGAVRRPEYKSNTRDNEQDRFRHKYCKDNSYNSTPYHRNTRFSNSRNINRSPYTPDYYDSKYFKSDGTSAYSEEETSEYTNNQAIYHMKHTRINKRFLEGKSDFSYHKSANKPNTKTIYKPNKNKPKVVSYDIEQILMVDEIDSEENALHDEINKRFLNGRNDFICYRNAKRKALPKKNTHKNMADKTKGISHNKQFISITNEIDIEEKKLMILFENSNISERPNKILNFNTSKNGRMINVQHNSNEEKTAKFRYEIYEEADLKKLAQEIPYSERKSSYTTNDAPLRNRVNRSMFYCRDKPRGSLHKDQRADRTSTSINDTSIMKNKVTNEIKFKESEEERRLKEEKTKRFQERLRIGLQREMENKIKEEVDNSKRGERRFNLKNTAESIVINKNRSEEYKKSITGEDNNERSKTENIIVNNNILFDRSLDGENINTALNNNNLISIDSRTTLNRSLIEDAFSNGIITSTPFKYEEHSTLGVTEIRHIYNLNTPFKRPELDIRKSLIHGLGAYAIEKIYKDQVIGEYVGEVICKGLADLREKKYKQIGIKDIYMFDLPCDYIIDATKYGSHLRFVNHSCEPNCYAEIKRFRGDIYRIYFAAMRDLAIGEELTIDYQFEKNDEDERIVCYCKSKECRNFIDK